MATHKIDPNATYTLTAKGAAAAAVAQAHVAAGNVGPNANYTKLVTLAAACGANGATGAALKAALLTVGDANYVGYACGSTAYIAMQAKAKATQPAK